MTRNLLLVGILIYLGFASSTLAQSGAVGFTTVAFDDGDQEIGGISETYLSYDLQYYYDAGADGLLSYENPYEPIDGDVGEGIDDSYFDVYFGLMLGIEVDYTTNDYRRNKIACADTIHYARLISTPVPLAPEPYYDPYQLGSITPGTYENSFTINTSGTPTQTYSSNQVDILGYTYACIRTPTVGSVVFEEMNNSPITTNPSGTFQNGVVFGGGKRIFADRQSPDDETNRRMVRVRARLLTSGGSPSYTSGVKVYFKNFDVDDPSSDPVIDDNGISGNDNRENRTAGDPYPQSASGFFTDCTFPGNCYGLSDSNGYATVIFMTTKQPGDNFVIGVSTDEPYLSQVTVDGTGLKDSSNQPLPTQRAQRSELLTVWRKVHLEVDSMGPVGNNLKAGRFKSRETVGSTPVWLTLASSLEPGRYQNGRMAVGTRSLEVLDNTDSMVRVQSNSGNVTIGGSSLYQMFDDDDFNDTDGPPPGDGTLDGDDGEDVTFRGNTKFEETFSRLQPSANLDLNPYAGAYIEPDYTWAEGQQGMNDSDVQFQLNVDFTPPNYENERSIVNSRRDSTSFENDEFWIGYILIAYQSDNAYQDQLGNTIVLDGDPDNDVLGGTAPPISYLIDWTDSVVDFTTVTRGSVGALVYIESMSDQDAFDGGDFRIRTVPHELGHQFGLRGDNIGFGIMSPEEALYFVPAHINIMRWRNASPGVG